MTIETTTHKSNDYQADACEDPARCRLHRNTHTINLEPEADRVGI